MRAWFVTLIDGAVFNTSEFVNFQSFADQRYSGKEMCRVKVHELVEHFQPCPLELSSYLSAAHECISGNYTKNNCPVFA